MQTAESRYDELVDRAEALYEDGRFQDGIELLEAESDGLDAWIAELAHLKACLLGVSGDAEGALRTLREASADGAWWAPAILTDDEDLEALQGRPEFQELVAVSGDRAADDPRPALVELPAVPLVGAVVALHGAGQRATHAARDWAGVLELGYALVCVESSQRSSTNYRSWPDRDRSAADIARAVGQLPAELTAVPLIAAGFSAGGRAALDWALTAHPVRAAGVVVMAPALRELPPASAGSLSPATIWVGTGDGLLEVVDGAEDRLTAFGCTIERLPDLGHTFPTDFADRVRKVLEN